MQVGVRHERPKLRLDRAKREPAEHVSDYTEQLHAIQLLYRRQ